MNAFAWTLLALGASAFLAVILMGFRFCKELAMPETRIDGACLCGTAVTKILNSHRSTCRKDGTRFIYTDQRDAGWCIFRCEGCNRLIEDAWIPTSEAVVHG